MISEIQITDAKRCAVPWWADVPALKTLENIKFKPGLNILWGRNGVGKSTIIQTISRLFCCGQSGRPFVSQNAIHTLYDDTGVPRDGNPDGVLPIHDGQAPLVFNPDKRVGLAYGGSAFDYDFIGENVQSMQRVSSGQQTVRAMVQQIAPYIMRDEPWPEIQWKIDRTHLNSVWEPRADFLLDFFAPKIEVGPRTLLMDEPEKSLDLDANAKIWDLIQVWSKSHQVIVATHSVFALGIEGANYIEVKQSTEDSYLQNSLDSLRRAPVFANP